MRRIGLQEGLVTQNTRCMVTKGDIWYSINLFSMRVLQNYRIIISNILCKYIIEVRLMIISYQGSIYLYGIEVAALLLLVPNTGKYLCFFPLPLNNCYHQETPNQAPMSDHTKLPITHAASSFPTEVSIPSLADLKMYRLVGKKESNH